MGLKKRPEKVYLYRTKWSSKVYKSYAVLMNNVDDNREGKIDVYELSESFDDSAQFKRSQKEQRERNESLDMILNEDSDPAKVRKIQQLMIDFEGDDVSWSFDKIMARFRIGGLNKENFKRILNKHNHRHYILYEGPDTVEWYETVLSLHNVKELNDKRVEPHRIVNFKQAKINNLKRKKDERKKVS